MDIWIDPCSNGFPSHVFCSWILSQTLCCSIHKQIHFLFFLQDHQHLNIISQEKEEKKESNINIYLFQKKFNGLGNESCDVVFCSCEALYCRKSKHTGPASGESPSHAFCSLTCPRTAYRRVGMKSPGLLTGQDRSQILRRFLSHNSRISSKGQLMGWLFDRRSCGPEYIASGRSGDRKGMAAGSGQNVSPLYVFCSLTCPRSPWCKQHRCTRLMLTGLVHLLLREDTLLVDTMDMKNHFQHTLTGIGHCQGGTLTGWNVSLDVAFQEGLIAKGTWQLIQTKMFLLHMPPTIGLHGELCVADCTNKSTFQAVFSYHKVLDAWNKKSGNVGFLDSSGSAHDYKWSCKRLQHESTTCLNNGLVSGNAQMFLLHMPCAASHVSDHFVAYCAQVPSVCSQN